MVDQNKQNLQYFEAQSMRELFATMTAWQEEHQKRLLSLNVQRDGDLFACIALTNPSEVVICSGSYYSPAEAKVENSRLLTTT